MHSVRNLGTALAIGSTPRGSWSTCHECHKGSAVDDDFAADQLYVPNDEMLLGDLDIRCRYSGSKTPVPPPTLAGTGVDLPRWAVVDE
jgi:hypothetical protein